MTDLEEQTIEKPGEFCEDCGARLTPDEIRDAMERGGPMLCKIHAVEVVPVEEDAQDFDGAA